MAKKILFVSNNDMHLNLFYLPYMKYLSEKGYIIHVASDTNVLLKYSSKKIKLPISRKPLNFGNIKSIFILKKIMEEEKYDFISTSTPVGSVVARLACIKSRKKYNTKLLYTVHGFHFYKGASKFHNFIYYNIEKFLMNFTDILITINEEDYLCAKHFKTDVRYIKGIGYLTDRLKTNLNKREKFLFKKTLGLNKDDYVITYVAELSKRKRQEYLVKTLSKMNLDNIKVLLVGSDNLNRKIHKLVKRKHLEDNIKLLGFRDDISEILDITDLVISVSKQEGLPINVMEAMYKNKPIIVTDCRGNRDLIKNNVNGIVVPINDYKLLIDKIKQIKDDSNLSKKLSDNNKYIVSEYSIENILNKYIEVYDDVLKR